MKTRRTCCGYGADKLYAFPVYRENGQPSQPLFASIARKCTMPKRVPSLRTDVLTIDRLPHKSLAERRELALRAFFYDFCLISTNQDLSQGYLSDLGMMTYDIEARPNIVKVCQVVSLASYGQRLQRPLLLYEAEVIYQELLGTFANAIEGYFSNDTENRLVAMILGIYQIALASEADLGGHETHANGLAALMNIGNLTLNPLNTWGPNHGPSSSSSRLQIGSMFSVLALRSQGETLDDLLQKLEVLWAKCEITLEWEALIILKKESISLEQRFAYWQDSRVREFKPTTVAHIDNHQQGVSEISAGFWPGKVDTYFDLYVAGVWKYLPHGPALAYLSHHQNVSHP
ncbi:hypothetical protein B7463_g11385, partial [Scytalidium lignicola]